MRTFVVLIGLCAGASAWSPRSRPLAAGPPPRTASNPRSFDPAGLSEVRAPPEDDAVPSHRRRPAAILLPSVAVLPLSSLVLAPGAASATASFADDAVPSALAAYGHYLSLLGILGCVVAERLTVKPNMSVEEEDLVAAADIGLGLFGVVVAYTGYLRATAYEKGFDFYSHEPLFWVKVAFVGVFGAASFFNTIVIVRRAVARRNGDFVPMGEKLAKRMVQICNAELVAIGTIPLAATFMARGVGYSPDFPWQAEAALAASVFGGLSFKYVTEALSFEDDVVALDDPSSD
ncbi:hypothetical protein ACHAWF_012474 [Thalassiosira exigua]